MTKYRKKPVVIEAFRVGRDARPDWFEAELQRSASSWYYEIEDLESTMTAYEGDYIIKDANGKMYPCKPDIFEKTYESAAEEQARFKAYCYTDKKTGDERAVFDYSGEVAKLLAMAIGMVHDIINENSGDEAAYNMLLGETLQTLARQEYKKEELENE